jgi:hypothetical protein
LSRVSIERSTRRTLHEAVAQAWTVLKANPTPAGAHQLNNLCLYHGLSDVAEQLELLEAAIEEGRDPAPFLRAAETLLVAGGVLAPS